MTDGIGTNLNVNGATQAGDAKAFETAMRTGGNRPPVFTRFPDNGIVHHPENKTFVYDFHTVDPDGDHKQYSIVGGADGDKFTITPDTGKISFKHAPDFENPTDKGKNNVYDVTVRITDSKGAYTQKTIWVKVKDVDEGNQKPVFDNVGPNREDRIFKIDENKTFVFDFDTTDPDGDSKQYSISGGRDGDFFEIDPHSGKLSFKEAPDFENPRSGGDNNTYDVTVRITDEHGAFCEVTVWVKVQDVDEQAANEPPVIVNKAPKGIYHVDENVREVTKFVAEDPNGDPVTFSIDGGRDADFFEIDPQTGELRFKEARDFENPQSGGNNNIYDVVIKVTDDKGASTKCPIWVKIKDVDEADPNSVIANPDTANTDQGQGVVVDVRANDEDPEGDAFQVTQIAGQDVQPGDSVDVGDGVAFLTADGKIEFIPSSGFVGTSQFEYTITDAQGATDSSSVRVTVNAGNPDPDKTLVDFNDLAAGTVVSDQIDGVTISANRPGSNENAAMIFDGANPTGGDDDLGLASQGKMLIISEDGDSNDPDDNAGGGTITFDFDHPSDVESLRFIDIEEAGGSIKLFDKAGDEIKTIHIPGKGDASVQIVDINAEDVAKMTVHLNGSGAVDDLCFTKGEEPDRLPEAQPDTFDGEFGETVTGDLGANDDEGDAPATYALTDDSPDGTVTVNDDGTFSFEPNDGFSGTTTFTYTLTDADGDESTATVTINIGEDPNLVPVAGDDSFTTDEDTPLTGSVAGNDTLGDPDNTFTVETGPANGTLVLNDDGTFEYTPNDGFNGTDSFTYTLTDGDGEASTATVTIHVNDVNDAPEAADDGATTDFNTPIDIAVLGNDTDPDGDPLTVTEVTQPANGTVTINDDGTVTYTPNDGFSGEDTFEYTISDGNGGTDTATVTVTVGEDPNIVPVAEDDNFATDEDTVLTGSVAGNDTLGDPDNTFTVETGPANGTLVLNDDGTFEYTPNADFSGNDTFTYTLTDADGESSTATVNIHVRPVDDGVNAEDDEAATDFETPIDIAVLGNDTDPEGTQLTVTDASDPANGSVVINDDGTITYTPDADFSGEDTFTYTITDEDGSTDTATVTVTVGENPDEKPIFTNLPDNGMLHIDENQIEVIDVDGEDPDGGEVSFSIVGGGDADKFVIDPATGQLSFKEAPDFENPTDKNGNNKYDVRIRITDDEGTTCDKSLWITVKDVDENGAPEATDDGATTDFNTPIDIAVLGNDTDPDGDPLTVTEVTQPANGTVTINDDGTVTYTPNDGFSGEDTFEYTISDGNGGTDTATVTVTVGEDPNLLPEAKDDSFTGDFGRPIMGNVLDNDDQGDGPATVAVDQQPQNGTVILQSNGQFMYVPEDGFSGEDTFTYTITDANGDTDTGTVTLTVGDKPNEGPDAENDLVDTDENTPVTIEVLANDSDPDGDTLEVTEITQPANGTAVLNDDGTVTYTPNDGFAGIDEFTYTISDGNGGTDTATVKVCVKDTIPDNMPPVARDDSATTDFNTPVTIDAYANDFDPDGDTVSPGQIVDQPINGTVELVDGQFVYTPDDGFSGTDSFTYTVVDADGAESEPATVTITVAEEDLEPVAVDDNGSVEQGQTLTGDVSINDTLGDGENTFSVAMEPMNGTLVLNDDGSYSYTPNANFVGNDVFRYTITDADGDTSTATVRIHVEEADLKPEAQDDVNDTQSGTPVSGDVSENDALGNGANTFALADEPLNGTVTFNDDGTYTYTPDGDFVGEDTFTYTVTDADGDSSTATVTITVEAKDIEPIARNDTNDTDENTPVDGDVSLNDVPGNGESTFTLDGQPSNGTVVLNEDGTYTYTPDDGFEGRDRFFYTVTDEDGDTARASVTITVKSADTKVEAVDDTNDTVENTPVSGNVLDNDIDEDGDTLRAYLASMPANGSVVLQPNGDYTYTPDQGFVGEDTFTYVVIDEDGNRDTATVTITVTDDGKEPPVAGDDSGTTDPGTPVSIDVLANDSDPDGGDVTVVEVAGQPIAEGETVDVTNGTVTLEGGQLVVTPNDGFDDGDIVFEYTIEDDEGERATATVSVHVNEGNNPPDAENDSVDTDENTPVTIEVLANDEDPDGDPLEVTRIVDQPTNGTVVLNDDGTVTYTPNDGFAGNDTFTYEISDGNGGTDIATVTVCVKNTIPDNTAPDAVDDNRSTPFNTPIDIAVLGNDTDPDGDPLEVIEVGQPSNGTVVLNDDGTVTYTPNDGFEGDDQFTYTISDGNGGTDTATVRIHVGEDPDLNPTAVDDTNSTGFDTPVTGDVSANDDEGDGPATFTLDRPAGNGTVVLNTDGTYTYTPNAGFSGTDTFTYTITDADGDTDTATVTITVEEDTNLVPEARDDNAQTAFETPVTGDVSTNDDEGDGPASFTLLQGPANGTVVLNADGTYSYTPNAGFSGSDEFTYTITDADGDTDTARVRIHVGERPDEQPEAVDDNFTGDFETPISGSVATNDDDGDGPATFALNQGPQNGTVQLNGDGTFTYTPDDGFSGTDTFTYTITDQDGDTDTATVTLTVGEAPDEQPEAVDDTNATDFETPVTGDVSTNDDEGDGPATFELADGPANGTVVLNADGTYTYTPDDGFSGTDTFTYTITDADGDTDTATVTITVGEAPDKLPDARNDRETTPFETPVSGDVSTNDDEGDGPATFELVRGPRNGTVEFNDDGTYTYTPDDGFEGRDTFTYRIIDADGDVDTARVRIDVGAKPDEQPEAVDDGFTTDENTPVTGDVSLNDQDGDGDSTFALASQPANGTVQFNQDGTFTYTPEDGFSGTDTFTYTITDADGDTDTATVTITVNDTIPDNRPPNARDDNRSTPFETPINIDALDNDFDLDGDDLSVVDFTQPANGTVTLNDDGTFDYTPDDGFEGSDTFTYTISDGNGGEDTATVRIHVGARPDERPDAVNDEFTTEFETVVTGDVSVNDTDGDGDSTFSLISQPRNGVLVFNDDGTFTYTPDDGFSGMDSFTYLIRDEDGDIDTATVKITVGDQPNRPPVAQDDSSTGPNGVPQTINLIGNDSDPDGDPLTITSIAGQDVQAGDVVTVPNGTVTVNGDGTVTVTPNDGFVGDVVFDYHVSDGNGGVADATVTATFEPDPNRPPVAVDDERTTGEDTAVVIDVLGNDSDPDGDTIMVTRVVEQPSNGTAVLNADGTITYTPNDGFFGEDTFTYEIKDGNGGFDVAEVTVTVEEEDDPNQPPVAVDDSKSGPQDVPLVIDLIGNDSDPDGDPLTITSIEGQPVQPGSVIQVDNGTVTVNGNGTVTVTPDAGFTGDVVFDYHVSDGNGGEDTATVTATFTSSNRPPHAQDDGYYLRPGALYLLPVLHNDKDPDGDPLTIAKIDGQDVVPGSEIRVDGGIVKIRSDGQLVFRGNRGAVGNFCFEYTVSDGNGGFDTAKVHICLVGNRH